MSPQANSNYVAVEAKITVSTTNDEKIKAIAKKAEIDESEVRERVDEELEDLKAHQASEISEEELRGHAISVVKNDVFNMTGGGGGFGGGDAEEVPILALGFQRKEADYFVTDNDALLGAGIVNPSDSPAGFATFIIDSGHGVDLEHAAEAFEPLTTVRGAVGLRQFGSWDGEPNFKKGGNPTYVCNTTDDSMFEIVNPEELPSDDPLSELPSDREAKREMIHNNFITEEDEVNLQTYAQHETVKNDNGYGIGFGVDVKRIRGEVVDAMIFDSGDGVMTITDDTIFSEDDIPEELISDRMRTPGLQVSCAGDLVAGENSILDIYGYIQQRDDGQYKMQALGIIPIVEYEYEGSSGSSSSDTEDEAVQEDTL